MSESTQTSPDEGKEKDEENPWKKIREMDREMDKLDTHKSGQCNPFLF